MTITLPNNARGPILDLELPASEPPADIILRNNTTGKSLKIRLPEDWPGTDVTLDFYRRTIRDANGIDRSGLLDPTDNLLWTSEPLRAGANDVEIEATAGLLVAKDDFNQAAGAVTGKALETGGNWEGDGDTDDFAVVAGATHRIRRTATADTLGKGRRIWPSTPKVAAVRVRADFFPPAKGTLDGQFFAGVFARRSAAATGKPRVDAMVSMDKLGATVFFLHIAKETEWLTVSIDPGPADDAGQFEEALKAGGAKLSLALEVVGETAKAWFGLNGLPSSPSMQGSHPWLKGTTVDMTTGQAGINEMQFLALALTRDYDRFRVYDLAAKAPYAAKATLRWEKAYY